jgi:exoribonuclease II
MERALYEYELEEHIDYWYEGLKSDRDQLVFAVTENSGHVAMVLITPDKTIYVNEEAREKLSEFWTKAYRNNINRLIPMMADNLANDIISVTGVKTVSPNQKRRWVSLRP